MGVPVSPRNIFPSNIQGLPTWYEVRVSERGWLGRRGGVDLMVAMNPQTWDADLKEIEPGGYLFYDSTRPLPASKFREDVNAIGMPLTAICNRTYADARQRQLFKNIMRACGGGHIVNISSTAGRIANPAASGYSASKFGIVAFSESLRREVYKDNIRVSVIEPGVVETELRDHIPDAGTKQALNTWASSVRQLQPEDVANAVLYCVTQPPHVNVNEILMRPTDQER